VQAVRHLIRGFFAATRRAGGRKENPSLDIFLAAFIFILVAAPAPILVPAPISAPVLASAPVALAPASAPVSAPAPLSEETGERIASALKALIDLYLKSFRDRNSLIKLFYKDLKKSFLSKKSFLRIF
jgi:hypothetical protein